MGGSVVIEAMFAESAFESSNVGYICGTFFAIYYNLLAFGGLGVIKDNRVQMSQLQVDYK